jgi:hypothetical protein
MGEAKADGNSARTEIFSLSVQARWHGGPLTARPRANFVSFRFNFRGNFAVPDKDSFAVSFPAVHPDRSTGGVAKW